MDAEIRAIKELASRTGKTTQMGWRASRLVAILERRAYMDPMSLS